MRAEAEAPAAGTVPAAERQAEEATRSAIERAREIEEELETTRVRETTAIARLREAREALSDHLVATRSALERVMAQVADERVTGLLPEGDVLEGSGEVVEPPEEDAGGAVTDEGPEPDDAEVEAVEED